MSSELIGLLDRPIRTALHARSIGDISLLVAPTPVADNVTKLVVRDDRQRPVAVVHCSSATSPDLVARGVRLIELARSRLGDELGRHVLLPIYEGEQHGLTYAITPYCTPLRTGRLGWRLQRLRLRTPLLDWTWGITNATAARVDAAKLDELFLQPLVRIIQTPEMPDRIRTAARRGLSRLERGAWQPRCVLTHNDLWQGNILIAPAGIVGGPDRSRMDRFVIIDWASAMLEGYPFVDLAKLGRSLGLSTARFRREIERHCAALDCQSEDAVYSLLAGMGRLGMSLECFSIERYIKLTRASFDALSRLVEPYGTSGTSGTSEDRESAGGSVPPSP